MMKNYSNTKIKPFVIRFLTIATVLAITSCTPDNSGPIEIAAESPIDSPYVLSKSQFEASAMELAKMEMHSFHEIVQANGMVDVPPKNRASISSYFGGSVKKVELLPGEPVKKDQILFTLENPDFVQIQQDYLEAKGQLVYLKSDYERQKNLAQDNVTSQKNFLKAESDYTVTSVKVASLNKKLTLMNINPNTLTLKNMRSSIHITSPINGFVTSVNIMTGTFLSPSQIAVSLVNTDHLHLELRIFEKDLPKVRVGQTIHFKTQENPAKEYEAIVHLINKTIDSKNRTIGIHGHLAEDSLTDRFAPGMYVEAAIYTTSKSKISLPREAVVEADGKFYVLVREPSTNNTYTFAKKEVETGAVDTEYIEILNTPDFNRDAVFLTKGAFNLIKE